MFQVLTSPGFLTLIAGIVVGVITIPGGIAQQALLAILAHFQRNLPAAQYAQLKALAVDVVSGVHQAAESAGWDSAAKKTQALTVLQQLAQAHGITRFDEQTIGNIIEKAWQDVKPTLPGAILAPIQSAMQATLAGMRNDVKTPS